MLSKSVTSKCGGVEIVVDNACNALGGMLSFPSFQVKAWANPSDINLA